MSKFLFVLNGTIVFYLSYILSRPVLFVDLILNIFFNMIWAFLYPVELYKEIKLKTKEEFEVIKKEGHDNWSLFKKFFIANIKGE